MPANNHFTVLRILVNIHTNHNYSKTRTSGFGKAKSLTFSL